MYCHVFFFFSSRRRHTRFDCDWSSDVCSSDLLRYLLDRFGGNLELALAAYHAGETRVSRESRVPRISETRQYVRKVIRFYRSSKRDGRRIDRLYTAKVQPRVTRRFANYLSPN